MATAAPSPSECKGPEAADMAQMLLMSKQDYARWHSYELHVSTAVNPGVRPVSCKLLGYLQCSRASGVKTEQLAMLLPGLRSGLCTAQVPTGSGHCMAAQG